MKTSIKLFSIGIITLLFLATTQVVCDFLYSISDTTLHTVIILIWILIFIVCIFSIGMLNKSKCSR